MFMSVFAEEFYSGGVTLLTVAFYNPILLN